jgi:hypothetical protein
MTKGNRGRCRMINLMVNQIFREATYILKVDVYDLTETEIPVFPA